MKEAQGPYAKRYNGPVHIIVRTGSFKDNPQFQPVCALTKCGHWILQDNLRTVKEHHKRCKICFK